MNILGWSVALCSGISVVVASVSGLVSFWRPDFSFTQWQSYALYVSVALLSGALFFLSHLIYKHLLKHPIVSPLLIGPRAIPTILQASLVFSVLGLIIILGIVLVTRKQVQPLSLLLDTSGTSGWGQMTAWLLGLSNSMYAFTSTDAAIHIAEEMVRPEKHLPHVVNMTLAIGFVTSFPLLLITILSSADLAAVASAKLPYGELFLQITGSKGITTFVMGWITLVLFSALIGQWVTTGRLAWAFARDGGLPRSAYFAHISKTYNFPVRTTVLALLFSCFYGLLYLASTTAFNSIITSAVLFSNLSYCVPQLIVAIRGRRTVLPEHTFDLGYLGYVCNYSCPVFVAALCVLVCFPPELPVTVYNANYTPVVLVVCYASMFLAWHFLGKNFKGPQIDWEALKNVKIT